MSEGSSTVVYYLQTTTAYVHKTEFIDGYALSQVIHRIQSKNYIWKP
jgi:hypothetical protein